MTAIIKTEKLAKHFAGAVAVDGVDLEVEEGEIFGLVGPDGAGKSTTIRMLASIMEPTSGDAALDGFSIRKDPERIKERIGYMSQRFGLYRDLTVMENIDFYADIYGVPKRVRRERVEELLAFSQLERFTDRLADNLSGGMKQKLGLVCALVHTPKILILDEPTNGVDPVSRRDFWRILYRLHKEGTTIFLSTAYLDEAERCSHVAFLYKGAVMSRGTTKELKRHLNGKILEVRCKAPRRALLELREIIGHDVVKLFGNRIHIYIYTEQARLSLKQVKEVLQTAKLGEYEIRETEPSLEDIFMHLMQEKAKGDADVDY